MKRGKRLIVLLAALVVVCLAAFAAKKLAPDDEAEAAETVSVLSLDSEDITALSWDYDGEELSVVKDGDVWVYGEDADFPLDVSYVSTMLSSVSSVTASKVIENAEDLSQYGLEEPVCTVSVTASDTTELAIGDETSIDGQRYLSTGDGNVYLVDSTLLESFSYGLYDLVETETLPTVSDITDVTVAAETQTLSLVYLEDSGIAYSDDYTWFLADGDSYLPLGTDETEDLISEVTGLTWQSCVSYQATEDGLDTFGLDSPAVTVTINYTETETVDTGETDDDGNAITSTTTTPATFTLEIGDYAEDGCYARLGGSELVYLIDSTVCDTLLYTGYDDLLTSDVISMDWDNVTAADITLDGVTYSLEKTEKETTDDEGTTLTETVWVLDDGETVDAEEIFDSLDDLSSSGSGEDLTADRSAEISFVFYQDSENWPQVELTFYQYTSDSCLVSLNGETRLFVARDNILSLVETVNTEIVLTDEEEETADDTEDTADTADETEEEASIVVG